MFARNDFWTQKCRCFHLAQLCEDRAGMPVVSMRPRASPPQVLLTDEHDQVAEAGVGGCSAAAADAAASATAQEIPQVRGWNAQITAPQA